MFHSKLDYSKMDYPWARSWQPAAKLSVHPGERPPVGQADAAMEAVARTEAAVGRPVSRVEVALWIGAHAKADPVAAFLQDAECLGRALEQLSPERLERLVTPRPNWQCVRTAYTVPGGCPERYTTRPLTEMVAAALELEDRLRFFTPARELESQQALWALSARLRAPVLQDILAERITTLSVVARPEHEASVVDNARALLTHAAGVLAGWAAQWPVNERSAKLAPSVALRAELDALERVQAPARAMPAITIVGARGATASHNDLAPYVACVPALTGREYASTASLRMFYDTARRVPNPEARWEHRGAGTALVPEDGAGMGWMLVDRVDAFIAIWETLAPPRAMLLLNGACAILGHIMRDPATLRAALASVTGGRGGARHMLVVALGLLGEAVALEEAIPDAADDQDTAAYVLACVLCSSDRVQLSARVSAVATRAASLEARRVALDAMRMIGRGALLTVVG